MSVYEEVKATGGYISNHASDLYIEVNEVNREILKRNGVENVPTFVNAVTGKLCYDVAFAYDPYWQEKERKAGDRVIYWVRSTGPEGKDRVPMFFKGKLPHRTDEGERGDIHARPVELGHGPYTATYGRDDFENEDGSKFLG